MTVVPEVLETASGSRVAVKDMFSLGKRRNQDQTSESQVTCSAASSDQS